MRAAYLGTVRIYKILLKNEVLRTLSQEHFLRVKNLFFRKSNFRKNINLKESTAYCNFNILTDRCTDLQQIASSLCMPGRHC